MLAREWRAGSHALTGVSRCCRATGEGVLEGGQRQVHPSAGWSQGHLPCYIVAPSLLEWAVAGRVPGSREAAEGVLSSGSFDRSRGQRPVFGTVVVGVHTERFASHLSRSACCQDVVLNGPLRHAIDCYDSPTQPTSRPQSSAATSLMQAYSSPPRAAAATQAATSLVMDDLMQVRPGVPGAGARKRLGSRRPTHVHMGPGAAAMAMPCVLDASSCCCGDGWVVTKAHKRPLPLVADGS